MRRGAPHLDLLLRERIQEEVTWRNMHANDTSSKEEMSGYILLKQRLEQGPGAGDLLQR